MAAEAHAAVLLGTTEGGAAVSLKDFAAFKEKLAASEKYQSLAAERTWTLLVSTLGQCGYEDKDFQEFVPTRQLGRFQVRHDCTWHR